MGGKACLGFAMSLLALTLLSLAVMGFIYAGRLRIVTHGVKHECLVLKAEDFAFLCPNGGPGEVDTCHAVQYTVQFNDSSSGQPRIAKTYPPFESDLYKDPKYLVGSTHDCFIVASSGDDYTAYWFMPSITSLKKALIGVGATAAVLFLLCAIGCALLAYHTRVRPVTDIESASMRRLLLNK